MINKEIGNNERKEKTLPLAGLGYWRPPQS